ncbi:amidase domain protein [Bordetella holmesii 44057]|nr:amidase domain protein [Bordetella holmesii 44057]
MISSQATPALAAIGPVGVRMREGLKPNRPQAEAGMRKDPPPSPP